MKEALAKEKEAEYREWQKRMAEMRRQEEEESGVVKQHDRLKEKSKNLLAANQFLREASTAAKASAAGEETSTQRKARLDKELARCDSLEKWSAEMCEYWVAERVGLPTLAAKLAKSTRVPLNGKLIQRLTANDAHDDALRIFRLAEMAHS